ncbi:alpha-N-acetylglucosaminidase (NAglu) tim-barrel domain containing protein [Nitzschia inconspicua]|uniref:Alpha-N-acetylglucosaminidase (NAglu) tim-barrel domain containing protein n=1 Tax=Nitzschia inconspicua TaxID=303405 RepID=A0A9K3LG66_9STRA|nr:alpha-N-acetylglucosaminidase (NAglu) tim-barrel domain containing protein [Nitzschia inconspicua]
MQCFSSSIVWLVSVFCVSLIPMRAYSTENATAIDTNRSREQPLKWDPPSWWDFSRPEGSVRAVYDLIDRVLGNPELKKAFDLAVVPGDRRDKPWFRIEQNTTFVGDPNIIRITATSVSELTAGLGHYFKEYCNFTIEWSTGGRAGGSHIIIPDIWPVPLHQSPEMINAATPRSVSFSLQVQRTVSWSYLMNVCTHSYSLVWYDWEAWQSLIDGFALRGINMILALTGQEEIQYQVFSKLGVRDHDIRSWFNGPAFLTWSRGQNEYGSGIAGPLPRSFMKSQWHLQREHILPRLRSLGIVGVLPAFQGNVPIQIKTLFQDSNITQQGETGWIDALDPLFGRIADLWMSKLIQDFGTDHYYQTDGYFNGGTAPWMHMATGQLNPNSKPSKDSLNGKSPVSRSHDESWYRRGRAVYAGLSRTDPQAYWLYQGFAFVGWNTAEEASYLKGFVDSVPANRLIIIDMGYSPDGQWQMWNNASFFGAPFIYTSLYNFGDTAGMRGDFKHLNEAVPFRAIEANASIVGIGATPEGIDHNPLYFELLFQANFRQFPIENLLSAVSHLNHKRYGLDQLNYNVKMASKFLLESVYSQGFSVRDLTGVSHISPPASGSLFEDDRRTPKPILCNIFHSWQHLILASFVMQSWTDPFLYDLINVGREVLAQLSTPAALNFSDAIENQQVDRKKVLSSGRLYIGLLHDLDNLVSYSEAFHLVAWIASARNLATQDSQGDNQNDCVSPILGNRTGLLNGCCATFLEWNARCQITTWNPTPSGAAEIPGGPIDYASKHWHGLISPYYTKRGKILLSRALEDESRGLPLNKTAIKRLLARHAYDWTTSISEGAFGELVRPHRLFETARDISQFMIQKYSHWFFSCNKDSEYSGKEIK